MQGGISRLALPAAGQSEAEQRGRGQRAGRGGAGRAAPGARHTGVARQIGDGGGESGQGGCRAQLPGHADTGRPGVPPEVPADGGWSRAGPRIGRVRDGDAGRQAADEGDAGQRAAERA